MIIGEKIIIMIVNVIEIIIIMKEKFKIVYDIIFLIKKIIFNINKCQNLILEKKQFRKSVED